MKSKITDEEIFALIDEGKKNSEIARHFGVSQPSMNKRINILRQKHESNLPEGTKKGEPELTKKHINGGRKKIDLDSLPEVESPVSLQETGPAPKPLGNKAARVPAKGLRFEDIKPGRTVLRNGIEVKAIGTSGDAIVLRVKGPGNNTRTEIIEKKNFDLDLWEAVPVETVICKKPAEKDQSKKTVFEKVAERQKEDLPASQEPTYKTLYSGPATINPDFEAAVQIWMRR
jgi:hypothetical protein